jgi:hypothetical protein
MGDDEGESTGSERLYNIHEFLDLLVDKRNIRSFSAM